MTKVCVSQFPIGTFTKKKLLSTFGAAFPSTMAVYVADTLSDPGSGPSSMAPSAAICMHCLLTCGGRWMG